MTDLLISVLQHELQARLCVSDRWLVWDNEWVVREHKYRARQSIALYSGDNLLEAISALKGEE